jgi:hypothetical protein
MTIGSRLCQAQQNSWTLQLDMAFVSVHAGVVLFLYKGAIAPVHVLKVETGPVSILSKDSSPVQCQNRNGSQRGTPAVVCKATAFLQLYWSSRQAHYKTFAKSNLLVKI